MEYCTDPITTWTTKKMKAMSKKIQDTVIFSSFFPLLFPAEYRFSFFPSH